MKKRFLFSTLAVLFSLSCAVFTSCSDDDDDDPKIELAINGESVVNNGKYLLAKSTSDPKATESGIVALSIVSEKEISNIQITVDNSWAKNVDIVDVNGVAYNGKTKEANPSQAKTIQFNGILGNYVAKINGQTFKFTLQNSKNESDYKGNSRYLSNKQTVIYDATGKEYASKIFNMTYIYDKNSNNRYLDGKVSVIDEELYNSASADYSKSELGDLAEEKDRTYSNKYSLSEKETPYYFIYKNGDSYLLVKVVSIKENILTAEVQY